MNIATSPPTGAATNDARQTSEAIGAVPGEHIESCSFPVWYPHLRSLTIRSIIIPLSDEFTHYLQEDGIVLPTTENELHKNDPRKESALDWSSDEEEEEEKEKESEDSVDIKILDEEENVSEEEEEKEIVPPSFPLLEKQMRDAIDKLGGEVFPKLDWSSPRDASFLKGDSIKCDNTGDIFLLLKGSDFVSHDMNHAFDPCFNDSKTDVTTATKNIFIIIIF